MIISRRKNFGIVDKISSLFKNNNTSQSSGITTIKVDKITFSDLVKKDYWPALVTLGIKDNDDGTPDHGWSKFNDWLKKSNMISGGNLIAVHVLSDNVNGDKGAAANVLEFSKGTKINTSTRLAYSNNFKWPEDFIYNYKSWYKSGK